MSQISNLNVKLMQNDQFLQPSIMYNVPFFFFFYVKLRAAFEPITSSLLCLMPISRPITVQALAPRHVTQQLEEERRMGTGLTPKQCHRESKVNTSLTATHIGRVPFLSTQGPGSPIPHPRKERDSIENKRISNVMPLLFVFCGHDRQQRSQEVNALRRQASRNVTHRFLFFSFSFFLPIIPSFLIRCHDFNPFPLLLNSDKGRTRKNMWKIQAVLQRQQKFSPFSKALRHHLGCY